MNNRAYTLEEIKTTIKEKSYIVGKKSVKVTSVKDLKSSKSGDISFCSSYKYVKLLADTKASAVILNKSHLSHCKTNAIVVEEPNLFLSCVLEIFFPEKIRQSFIHPTAIIHKSAYIDINVTIGAYVILEKEVVIGSNSIIENNSIISRRSTIGKNVVISSGSVIYSEISIGDHCFIGSNSVIGSIGFGFFNITKEKHQSWIRRKHIGSVRIKNHVEIGSSVTIDRGTISDTIINNGTKIDSQVHIGHNVEIGEHTIICGSTAIGGSTVIGDYCMIGGKVGIKDHLYICNNVTISAGSSVIKNITNPGSYMSTFGVQKAIRWQKAVSLFHRMVSFGGRLEIFRKEN